MTIIAIAVLAILLLVLIIKSTKDDIKEFGEDYSAVIKQFFTAKTKNEFLDDMKHVGATLFKAGKQIFRALGLLGAWLIVPIAFVALPIFAAFAFIYKAFIK